MPDLKPNKFTVKDNNSCFQNEEVVINYRRDPRNARFWVMSMGDALMLQDALEEFLDRKGHNA